MRKFLTTIDIAQLSGYSRAQIWAKAKASKIPGQQVKHCGRRFRYIDCPEIRMWCELKRRRVSNDELAPLVVETIVRAVIARDYLADPEKFEKFFLREICAQLDDSKDPDQLLKKWEQAIVHRRPEDLPHVDLARLGGEVVAEIGSEVVAEMRRQLVDSKNPEKLIKKWGRAVWDQRFEDLPHVM